VLTEYDIVTGTAGGDHNTWATDVMSRELVEVDADTPVIDAVERMNDRNIRHLVVRDGSRVGILGLTDCVPLLLAAVRGSGPEQPFEENQ
jgi:predicted transcriptional regulator